MIFFFFSFKKKITKLQKNSTKNISNPNAINSVERFHTRGWVVKAMLCVHICKEIKRHNVCEIFVMLFG
jgi:hypothetical protein